MARNMKAGRARLTDVERRAVDALLDGTPEGERKALKLQVTLAHARSKDERRAKGRSR